MLEVIWDERTREGLRHFADGAFLTTAHDGVVNTMTISWGQIGIIWGKPIFTVVVRPQRYTYGLLSAAGEFTVSIPCTDMAEALAYCGSNSGRDGDKLAEAGLEAQPGRVLSTPVITGGGLHFECRVVHRQVFDSAQMEPGMAASVYPTKDYHTQFFGEIVAYYSDDEL
jgi:flavin reductase (DIM6/NTAB) family NADH-FMN oxidoreductase RutF